MSWGVYTTGAWEEKSDEISFADFRFSITHHYLVQEPSDKDGKEELVEDALPLPMQDLLCMNNDFPPRAHCLGCPLTPLPPVSMAIRLTYVLQDWQQYFWPQQPPEVADITHALSKLTEPAPVPIHKLSVTNMVHSAKKKIRKHRGVDESPLNNEVLNTILLFLFPDAADKLADGFESRTSASAGNNPPAENEDYMLNCCIERKKARDEGKRGSVSDRSPGDTGKGAEHSGDNPDKEKEVGKSWESWSDSEEEFFECLSDTEDLKGNGQENGKKGGAKEGNKEPVNLKPEGRLHPHGKLTLLHPGEPLYIPITQAANPGCCLEDFVRWYSPRDYIEEEVVDEKGNIVIKGELSARMKIPSNMWVEAWETAKPVPARRQKRLFDDTREAEKVLHYLAVQKPADLARHLLPCIIHAAVLKVKEEEALEDISSVKKIIKQIISHSSKVLRFPNPEEKKLEEIIAQIMSVEAIIARARSLKAKFGVEKCENEEEKEDLQRFVNCLLDQPEVSVIGAGRGPAGSIIHKLFVNAQRVSAVPPLDEELRRSGSSEERRLSAGAVSDFPPPTGREVILRTTVPRPAPYSKPLPQRMYSVLTKEDFRLAGAFSADTTFF
ncbi:rab3 gtpase-activating protein catalytic hypothetical protein [Limosa lapponica baueri]|uniref:Rab3 GTPase-activating protein catalytic subunit n=1 Tax=Limosa lapponica baueri TaxID=1758121 RepID=A0A2I0TGJ9_LIMLA|nr:rab3 gtpase-activating protein catalytic hypothetical protein [Limosa lapponica baueri]